MRTYPESFLRRMEAQLGADFPAFCTALNEPPKKALHINTLKTDRTELSKLLGMPLPALSENPDGAAVPPDFNPNATPLHAAGLFYMQEATAQAPVAALTLPENPVVLDLCAAPGGKSAQLAAKMQGGVLVSNEIVPSRAEVLAGNLERMGVVNAIVTNAEPKTLCEKLARRCDAVLVDAPCAGESMFRKDEQAVRDWSEEHVEACAVRQRAILEEAQKAVKPVRSSKRGGCIRIRARARDSFLRCFCARANGRRRCFRSEKAIGSRRSRRFRTRCVRCRRERSDFSGTGARCCCRPCRFRSRA